MSETQKPETGGREAAAIFLFLIGVASAFAAFFFTGVVLFGWIRGIAICFATFALATLVTARRLLKKRTPKKGAA